MEVEHKFRPWALWMGWPVCVHTVDDDTPPRRHQKWRMIASMSVQIPLVIEHCSACYPEDR